MESDLISRSAVLEYLCSGCSLKDHGETHACGTPCSDYTGIKDLPAIDAVPVVQCKSCMKRSTFECPMYSEADGSDYGLDIIINDRTDDNGFCNEGARMDAEVNG